MAADGQTEDQEAATDAAAAGEPASEPEAPQASARQLLVDWANEQDHWVRRLVAEVLASGAAPSEEVADEIFRALLAEKHLSSEEHTAVPALVLEASEEAATEALVITRLSEVSGVNALASGQAIDFNTGLTVLFGENAAGKTGYARVLKRLAAVRTAEEVLPNVHDPAAPEQQSARVDYCLGAAEQTLQWQGESGVSPFTHVAIFDSPCVRLHVDEALSYVYTPSDLALFPVVTEALNGIRQKLSTAADERRPGNPALLPRFTRGTAAYAMIETLGPTTDLEQLRTLAAVSDEDAGKLSEFGSKVAALQSETSGAQLRVARSRHELHEQLVRLAETVSRFESEAYNAAVREAAEADQAYEALRGALIEGDAEVSETWQQFVLTGDALGKQLHEHEYPEDGDECLYCKQPLGADALALIERYREFANAEARKRAEAARETASTLSRDLCQVRASDLRRLVEQQQEIDADDPALEAATALIDLIESRAQAAGQLQEVAWDGVTEAADRVARESVARRDAAASLVADLTGRAEERAQALSVATAERDALKDRLELKRLLPAIEEYVASARWAEQASQLEGRFPGLQRSLTETSKEASSQLLNADFEQRFYAECEALRAPRVDLDFPGRQGQAARRKSVASRGRPSDVLSEGEQKVIALADFLAEAGLRLTPSPVIFDDPVNSLDHRRVREVAARIASLSRERQVIVFTHNIWLATELLAYFERETDRCSYFGVTDDGAKGVVTAASHPRWDTVKKTAKRINALIQDAEAADGATRDALIEQAYSTMRAWCEIVTETELLKGVTQRYQANVAMTMLPQIRTDRLAPAIAEIVPVFEKACRIMEGHSQPLETLAVRPTLSELKDDWAKVDAARTAYIAD